VHGDVDGAIGLRHGELIHAECHDRVGMPALVELLTVQRGQLETAALDHASRTITGPFHQVLLDGLRALDEVRRPAGLPTAAAVADDWLDDRAARAALDREALQRWLGEHAPGAGAWRIDAVAAAIERIDPLGPHPERELTGPPGSLGWACELAELADPAWTRAELLAGGCAIAVFRVSGVVIAFARLVAGDAMLRRFQVESARLMRWLTDRAGSAP
jgi:hypothetical protein